MFKFSAEMVEDGLASHVEVSSASYKETMMIIAAMMHTSFDMMDEIIREIIQQEVMPAEKVEKQVVSELMMLTLQMIEGQQHIDKSTYEHHIDRARFIESLARRN